MYEKKGKEMKGKEREEKRRKGKEREGKGREEKGRKVKERNNEEMYEEGRKGEGKDLFRFPLPKVTGLQAQTISPGTILLHSTLLYTILLVRLVGWLRMGVPETNHTCDKP